LVGGLAGKWQALNNWKSRFLFLQPETGDATSNFSFELVTPEQQARNLMNMIFSTNDYNLQHATNTLKISTDRN